MKRSFLSELVQSDGFKKFMSKLYGIGAAIVILGALFKIQHYPGAGIMLIIGLTTEALIFFISAFEPPHEEVDWALVYPELSGIEDDISKLDGVSSSSLEKLQRWLQQSDLEPELFTILNKSISKLNVTAEGISDISDATQATTEYIHNVSSASESCKTFSESVLNSLSSITSSSSHLSDSEKALASMLEEVVSSFKQNFDNNINASEKVNDELLDFRSNLSNVNSLYANHINSSQKSFSDIEKLQFDINTVMHAFSDFSEYANGLKDEISSMSQNMATLNLIYANMLNAMNSGNNKNI